MSATILIMGWSFFYEEFKHWVNLVLEMAFWKVVLLSCGPWAIVGTSCHIWFYRECVFYCFWKCYVAVDVRSLCLMHNDGVSSELELWTISAWTANFWESVGKRSIFIIVLDRLQHTENWLALILCLIKSVISFRILIDNHIHSRWAAGASSSLFQNMLCMLIILLEYWEWNSKSQVVFHKTNYIFSPIFLVH